MHSPWVEVDPALALSRGVSRDTALEAKGEAARLHRERYQVAEELYVKEVNPQARADVVIDNNDLDGPRVVQRRDR